jgi:hypothetical protein
MNSNPPSNAQDLFDRLTAQPDAFARISALVNSNPPTYETEWLDFKGASRIPDDVVQKKWSKALAGFANTSGGVLVWGIDAREDPGDKVDAARGFSLVNNPHAFKSRLNELLVGSTEPPVHNVVIEPVCDPASDTQGFVICLIPESRFKPHRAEREGQQWYMRAADSFTIIPVSHLRALFYPRSEVQLVVRAKCGNEPHAGLHQNFVVISIENTGNASAYDVFLNRQTGLGVPEYRRDLWDPIGSGYEASKPIHPGERVTFCKEVLSLKQSAFTMKFRLYARNAQPFESELECKPEHFESGASLSAVPTRICG